MALPRLVTLLLFGNPVLGPAGEDPLLIYVEALVELACLNRDGTPLTSISSLKSLPKRNLKIGVAVGRQGTYRDFAVVQVTNCERSIFNDACVLSLFVCTLSARCDLFYVACSGFWWDRCLWMWHHWFAC